MRRRGHPEPAQQAVLPILLRRLSYRDVLQLAEDFRAAALYRPRFPSVRSVRVYLLKRSVTADCDPAEVASRFDVPVHMVRRYRKGARQRARTSGGVS